ncbi:MAG: S9 family peptidase [Parachlamydiaceae bacterium]
MITAPYSTWTSPITPEKIAEGSNCITHMLIDGGDTYWCEMRPANKGRSTIVRRESSGKLQDVTPPEFNSRTLVHEYGGGSFTVANGIVYASNSIDNALYVIKPGEAPHKLTEGQTKEGSQHTGTRFADLQLSFHGIIAVAEHHQPGKAVENFLALIDIKTGTYKKLAGGCDFYSSPAISPDGKKIAWLSWNHPHMPWTWTELWIAEIGKNGLLAHPQRIAGETPESILCPQWSPDGTLYFVSDRSNGWWNIHRFGDIIENICPIKAEVGEPLWLFGKPTYAFLDEDIVFTYNSMGKWNLGVLDPQTKQWQPVDRPSVVIHQLRSGKSCVRFLEGYTDRDDALIELKTIQNSVLRDCTKLYCTKPSIDPGYISTGQHIAFPSENRTSYGFYYPPRNKDFQGMPGTQPPLIVTIHGGPTGQARASFNLKHQFWTSRGFAVLDVNYGGSSGYGRPYRQLLDRNWGVVDVEDCINGALYLAGNGLADRNNLFIRGGSSGGYTTLAVLVSTNIFRAGASYYGIADITALAKDTHKFEASYNDELMGKYSDEKDVWEARSPINSVDKISTPLIIFQGEDDAIVPKNQSIMIYEALKSRGISVEIHIYPEEAHGFRQAANICDALTKEAAFFKVR